MILPGSAAFTLALFILSMICMGSWASTYKLCGKWRWELYYFDFAFGLLGAALLAAFTFGSLGFDGFSFMDDFLHAGKKQILFVFAAGAVFNLANMLIVAAISIGGMAIPLSISLSIAAAIGVVATYLTTAAGNAVLLFSGALVLLVSVIFAAVTYRNHQEIKLLQMIEAGLAKSTKKKVSIKAVTLSIFGGILLGGFSPILQLGIGGDIGLGPYSATVIVAIGVLFTGFVLNLFFMNLPIEGEPVEITDYFRASVITHLKGMMGGALWSVGMVSAGVAAIAEGDAKVPVANAFAFSQGAILIAVFWGLFIWKDLDSWDARVKTTAGLMVVLFILGTGLATAGSMLAH